jgi:hypothetical protein
VLGILETVLQPPRTRLSKGIKRSGWWGRRFRLPTAGSIKRWQAKAPAPPFFMKFRGPKAHPNRQLSRKRLSTEAHRAIAPGFVFWYPVGRAPLTLPVAHVQSKLAPIFTSGTEVAQNVESQENPARILP